MINHENEIESKKCLEESIILCFSPWEYYNEPRHARKAYFSWFFSPLTVSSAEKQSMKQYCWSSCSDSFVIGVTAVFSVFFVLILNVILKMVKVFLNWCVLCGILHLTDEYVFNFIIQTVVALELTKWSSCLLMPDIAYIYGFIVHHFWNSAISVSAVILFQINSSKFCR